MKTIHPFKNDICFSVEIPNIRSTVLLVNMHFGNRNKQRITRTLGIKYDKSAMPTPIGRYAVPVGIYDIQ